MDSQFTNIEPNTLFTGRNLFFLPEMPSTNDFAADLLNKQLVPEGTAILTLNQTKGKGQRGNTWYVEANKNLTVSFVFHPSFLYANQQFSLTQAVSLAVADMVAYFCEEPVSIKWPNDIYVNNEKLAGILIENTLKGNTIGHTIVGIGINVNQTFFQDIPHVTSLKKITQSEFELPICFQVLCSFLEARYIQLRSHSNQLKSDYMQKLYRLNQKHRYIIQDKTVLATITGVSPNGYLQVLTEQQESLEMDFKEIKFVI